MIIGFTCGAFDLFHAGHNILLRDCKRHCGKLVVGLQTDPTIDRLAKNKPIQTIYERYTQLSNCEWVDEIIPYETEADLLNLIATTPMDVRFLGEDYYDKSFTGEKLCDEMNIKVLFMPRKHNFSSSELRKRLEDEIPRLPTFLPSKGSVL